MKKAFFYDTLCGMVYRCMFAGVDECGHAQWVSITPGEESKTLQDVVIDEELQGYRFILICMDDEPAQPEIIFKVLGKAIEDFVEEVGLEIATSVRHMKRLGIKWEKSPLELDFCVFKERAVSARGSTLSGWKTRRTSGQPWLILTDSIIWMMCLVLSGNSSCFLR